MEILCIIRICNETNFALVLEGIGSICETHSRVFLKPPEDICSIRECPETANSLLGGIGPLCTRHSNLILPLKAQLQ